MPRSSRTRPVGHVRKVVGFTAIFIVVVGLSTLFAQSPGDLATVAKVKADLTAVDPEPRTLRLLAGRSLVVNAGAPILRVSLTSADVADVVTTGASQLIVQGKTPGTISMFVWERTGAIQRYEITVLRDISQFREQVQQMFPDEALSAVGNGKTVVLSGKVSTREVADRVVSLAAGFVDKKEDIINLMQLPAPTQVLLHVRFAEVNRSALTELGASLFTSARGIENNIGRTTTGQFPAPTFSEMNSSKVGPDWQKWGAPVTSADGKLTFSDFLNFFLFNEKYDLGAVVRALQSKGLFQSLAEPNLVAESGKEASFLAGGEFPVPIAQPSGGGVSITVQFKEFGIRLNFVPVVTGNRVHLKVRPEVSTLDFANGLQLQGFRIPSLATRRMETELELQSGQTFAIAGLINNQMTKTLQKVPGIGDIPVLGLLFKSEAARKERTELVVMITPEILPITSPGVTTRLPRQQEPYLAPMPDNKSFDPPPAAFRSSGGTSEAPQPETSAGSSKAGAKPVAPTVKAPEAVTPEQRKALEQERRNEQKEADRQARLSREQAKRDAEAAKRAAEQEKKDNDAKKKQQEAIDQAEARAKAARAAYEAELAKIKKAPQQ